MTRKQILALIDRELHRLNDSPEADAKELESLIRARKTTLEMPEDASQDEGKVIDFTPLLARLK